MACRSVRVPRRGVGEQTGRHATQARTGRLPRVPTSCRPRPCAALSGCQTASWHYVSRIFLAASRVTSRRHSTELTAIVA